MSSAALAASVAAESTSARYAAGAGLLVLAQDAALRVWSLASLGDASAAACRGSAAEEPGAEPGVLLDSPPRVTALAVGERRDGIRLVAAASSETLLLHPLARGELRRYESRSLALESFGRAEVRAAHFDGAARRLALCAGTEVWLVDADTCRPLLMLQGHAAPTSMCSFASASAAVEGV